MANSRKLTRQNKRSSLQDAFKRALGDILARVSVSADAAPCRIGVAYSGGLDSSMLLQLCGEYARSNALTLYVFHVHHGLSRNASAWAAHCQKTAEQQGAIYQMVTVTVDSKGPHGIEEAARIARYGALGQLCKQHQVRLLLTGHHQDDQAETFLLQLARGAGLAGLACMAPLQQDHLLLSEDLFLGRPLLQISRREIVEAASAMSLQHVEDESNLDARYRRNAVRLHILPSMEAVFPNCVPSIARSAGHAQFAAALLEDLAVIDLASCESLDGTCLQLKQMRKLPERRMINLLRYWVRRQTASSLSAAQLAELREQMFNAADDAKPVLDAGAIRLWRFREHLFVRRKPVAISATPTALRWLGEEVIDIPSWHGRLTFRHSGGPDLSEIAMQFCNVLVTPRSGGERMKAAHNRPTKALKALYQEKGIPPWQRERLPLIFINGSLAFVAGIGMDVRHAISENGVLLDWDDGSGDEYE